MKFPSLTAVGGAILIGSVSFSVGEPTAITSNGVRIVFSAPDSEKLYLASENPNDKTLFETIPDAEIKDSKNIVARRFSVPQFDLTVIKRWSASGQVLYTAIADLSLVASVPPRKTDPEIWHRGDKRAQIQWLPERHPQAFEKLLRLTKIFGGDALLDVGIVYAFDSSDFAVSIRCLSGAPARTNCFINTPVP